MTLLIIGLSSPLQHVCKMTMKIIDQNMEPEVSILFTPDRQNHQKKAVEIPKIIAQFGVAIASLPFRIDYFSRASKII